jgi:hypothetical protein
VLLSHVDSVELSDCDEVIIKGHLANQRIVVRVSRTELDEFLDTGGFELTPPEEAGNASLGVIERVVARKYRRGQFHTDRLGGLDVACIHLCLAEMLTT